MSSILYTGRPVYKSCMALLQDGLHQSGHEALVALGTGGGGGNSLPPYSQQRPMRTDLSGCLGLIDHGQYKSTVIPVIAAAFVYGWEVWPARGRPEVHGMRQAGANGRGVQTCICFRARGRLFEKQVLVD